MFLCLSPTPFYRISPITEFFQNFLLGKITKPVLHGDDVAAVMSSPELKVLPTGEDRPIKR